MTVTALAPASASQRFRSTDDLVEALGVPFSPAQLEAITAPLEPGVIIAGAGSGKTTVMAARVVWLVGTGAVRPEEVLGLTFTRKAAAELSNRVRTALLRAGVVADGGVDESGEQLIMTYDAFAARLVAEHGLRLGFEADPTMLTGATRYRVAARVVKAAAGPFEHISRLRPATVTERVLRLDADLQSHLIDPTELDRHARGLLVALESAPRNNRGRTYVDVAKAMVAAQERLELASLVAEYQALKLRLGLVEFADQMAIAARLAVEAPGVSAALRSSFAAVLLDEYQDTSAAQATMLRGLFSGLTPSEGLGHPVTAVGDPLQAIYGWRGAAASNILTFADTFRRRNGRPATDFALTINRRSGHSILDLANGLSAPLRDEASGPGVGRLEAPAEAPAGEVRAATFETWGEEVGWVADQVVAVRTAGPAARWADIAVLTRRNADIAPLYGELTAREVPVEIVGLGGLLHLPEVMDVTATLRLVDDVTANPDLVRLLTGPRWRIGPRDLALLGRRALELARVGAPAAPGRPADAVLDALEHAVADQDPTDVVSLLDALEDPGEGPYADAARERFARLAEELAYLRRHVDEPVLDLARRIIATLGLDIELLATPEYARSARRDQLGAFLDAIAAYVDVDGEASLTGLLGYLQAEVDQGAGLDQAVPSDREAVKLLTVHKAKGLEWEAVFLPALMQGTFPSDRVTDNWVTNPAVLPADLRGDADSIPQLAEASMAAMGEYKAALSEQQLRAEDRLAYVAATRAKRLLVGSGHSWRPELVRSRTPSSYLRAILAAARAAGGLLAEAEPPGPENPLVTDAAPYPWPAPLDPDGLRRREDAAAAVRRAQGRFAATGAYEDPSLPSLLLDDEERLAGWDSDLHQLLAEARAARSATRTVLLPPALSTTAVLRLQADPDGFTAELARPMPQPPSRAARFGTRFHLWVERYFGPDRATGALGQQLLVDPDDLPDRADAGAYGEEELRALCDAFAAGRFGRTTPYALEAPFSVLLGGRLVRGRVDAVYADAGEGYRFRVVDWKTSRIEAADPLQLAVYRLAWAEAHGLPPAEVDAVFYHVRTDRLIRPDDLPGRPELERLLAGEAAGGDYAGSMINWAMASDLDRVDHHRASAEWVAGLWRAEDALLLKLDGQARFTTNTEGSKLRMTRPFVEFDLQRHRLLGLLDGSPIFAVEALTEGEVHDLREVGNQLSDNERDIAAAAAAVISWHRLEPMCPQCGGPTRVVNGGFARHCAVCERDHFPRTDPAVIVAVVDAEDRLLLGGQPTWGNRVSVLAGFVEAGESLEQAIHREIGEEVDVELAEVTYFGSQPWPFPRSLMVGFFARATTTRICVDVTEIAHAEWHTRDGLRGLLASGELGLPGRSSIASRLIQTWLDGPTPLPPP